MKNLIDIKEAQDLWLRFSLEDEQSFWKSYDKLLQKAKSSQSSAIQRFDSIPTKVRFTPPPLPTPVKVFNAMHYFPWLRQTFRITCFFLFLISLGTLPNFFWLLLFVTIGGELYIKSHQAKQVNFEIHSNKLVVGNRKLKNITEHYWRNIDNIELVLTDVMGEGYSTYKFILTDCYQETHEYDYKLNQVNHIIFFEQLVKKIPLVAKPSSYLSS